MSPPQSLADVARRVGVTPSTLRRWVDSGLVPGQAMSQIADAEVRLFHLYVHEPLMRDGVPGWEMAEEMEGLGDEEAVSVVEHFVEQVELSLPEEARINQASRVAARAAAGGVLVTRPVVEHAGPDLTFERIGEVRLKGFTLSTEIFLAHARER